MIKIFIESGVNTAQKKGSKRTTNEQNFVETYKSFTKRQDNVYVR